MALGGSLPQINLGVQEDCRFQMLNDDEIVTSVPEESEPVDDETDEDEDNNKNEVARVHQMQTRFLL
ncbi:hypothetical protein TNCV_2843441 [Trichonephila clavipes]|nr:hypothetical protein TNCV_2843441 [Trichonephila clavipes]